MNPIAFNFPYTLSVGMDFINNGFNQVNKNMEKFNEMVRGPFDSFNFGLVYKFSSKG